MTPEYFHNYYSFEESILYVLTNELSYYQLNPINKGWVNGNREILWKYDFEETKVRVSKGLLYDGTIHKGIIGLENLL